MSSSDISILGFSSVASIVSLLLADSGVEHTYYMKKSQISPLQLPPLSNPLVNGPTQRIEANYFPQEIIEKIKRITTYKSECFDINYKSYHTLNGTYITPTYALDNRIRQHCFLEKIKVSDNVKCVELADVDELILTPPSTINIIGGGIYSCFFDEIQGFSEVPLFKKRDLFFFNLVCDDEVLEKYSDVNVIYIDETSEVLIYPFLHISGKIMLNITVNVIKGGKWDLFIKQMKSKEAFGLFMNLLSNGFKDLEKDFRNCSIADDYFIILNTTPYYKYPVKKLNNNLIIGVGEAVSKADPLLGQGYNSGVELGFKLVEHIVENKNMTSDLIKIHNDYSVQRMEYLYHLNRVSTQGNENKIVSQVYQLATKNKRLSHLLFSTYDDIALYFPWLIDEDATRELIQMHSNG